MNAITPPRREPDEVSARAGARPTRIVHVFGTFEMGGSQARFIRIARASPPHVRHAVIAVDGRTGARDHLAGAGDVAFPSGTTSSGTIAVRLSRIRRALLAERPDLVATYNWGAIEWALAAEIAGLRHIHYEDGFGRDESVVTLARRDWFRTLALRSAQAVIVPSFTLAAIAERRWCRKERLRLIPNGVDVRRFSSSPAPRTPELPPHGVLIGWAGALRPEKNLPRLLEAFAQTSPGAWLVLIGEGGERTALESAAAALGISSRVLFLGHRTDIDRLLPQLDILALSSDTEQMPISVLEGMASGLPVVSTDVGDVRRMVAEANLPFVVPRATAPFVHALRTLAADAGLRRAIGEANRQCVAKAYPEEAMTAAHLALFEDATSSR